MIKNVTVTLDEDALSWARMRAARENSSVSRLLGGLIEEARARDGRYQRAMRAALEFAPLPFPEDARYLTREEAHRRAGLR